MKIAIYVFIGALAAFIVAFLLNELRCYILRINRKLRENEPPLRQTFTPYNSYQAPRPWETPKDIRDLSRIADALESIDSSITEIIEMAREETKE